MSAERLRHLLQMLGEREREIVALRFGADLSGAEIADLTGLSLANVQQILSRSLKRLRALLEDADPGGRGAPLASLCPRERDVVPDLDPQCLLADQVHRNLEYLCRLYSSACERQPARLGALLYGRDA